MNSGAFLRFSGVSFSMENAIGTIRAICAGRFVNMMIRSARLIASERSWVTRSAVFPECLMIFPISSLTVRRVDNRERKKVHLKGAVRDSA